MPDATPKIPLGPFDLTEVVGKGGMGTVWRGVHRIQGVSVAVKVVTNKVARDPQYLSQFRREVQATAGLDHPSVITVLDYGQVDEQAELLSDGELVAGSPYLAMEFASGGTLEDVGVGLTWGKLRPILFHILDALAHAHARQVIHRDLKPNNILVTTVEDGGAGLKLTDFGLAHAMGARSLESRGEGTVGTPSYMPPEQLMGRWRDYGPWTDLYALGVVAFQLASGRLPFSAKTFFMLAQAHLEKPPPPLNPPTPYPDGFEAWIGKLLAKSSTDRFRRAADAAWALSKLDLPHEEALPKGSPFARPSPTTPLAREKLMAMLDEDRSVSSSRVMVKLAITEGAGGLDLGHAPTLAVFSGGGGGGGSGALPWEVEVSKTDGAKRVIDFDDDLAFKPTHEGLPPIRRVMLEDGSFDYVAGDEEITDYDAILPPMPASWRQIDRAARSIRLIGAGLGLYGLRRVPLVARFDERGTLWRALSDVRRDRRARLVVVGGSAGSGKSALVQWLVHRAHEVGAATTLHVHTGPEDAPTEALQEMVATTLGCNGLPDDEIYPRVKAYLSALDPSISEYEPSALTELIAPRTVQTPTLQTTVVRMLNPAARYAVIRRLLVRLSQERPVILWIDSAEHAGDALALTDHLLDVRRRESCPVLIVVNYQAEALKERPFESRQMQDLLALGKKPGSKGVEHMELGPLAAEDQAVLIHRLLGLEPGLARQVQERSEGNPLFAVQLIGDWVIRGVLQVTGQGFALKSGEEAELPDDIHQVWRSRMERFVAQVETKARHQAQTSLEIAAVLGSAPEFEVWRATCAQLDVAADPSLLDRLVAEGLLVYEGASFRFVHAMLRESLERLTRERHAWVDVHAACAEALLGLYGSEHPDAAERIARHLTEAGRESDAIAPLLVGVRALMRSANYRSARELFAERSQALGRLGAGRTDPRVALGWSALAEGYIDHGRIKDAGECVEHLKAAAKGGDPVINAELDWITAAIDFYRGMFTGVLERLQRAATVYHERGMHRELAGCYKLIGAYSRLRGEYGPAVEYITLAHDLYVGLRDDASVAASLLLCADVYRLAGDVDTCADLATRGVAAAEGVGDRNAIASGYGLLGIVARHRGDLDGAESHYLHALNTLQVIDSPNTGQQRANLAVVFLIRGIFQQARWMLEAALDELQQAEQYGQVGAIHALLLPCMVEDRDWASFDLHYNEARVLLEDTGMLDPDVAWALEIGAEKASIAGRRTRGLRAFEIALQQWIGLGDHERAEHVRVRIGAWTR